MGDSIVVRTMCPMSCHPTLCGMLAEVRDGTLVSVKGDEDNPDSRGFLCIRGTGAREKSATPRDCCIRSVLRQARRRVPPRDLGRSLRSHRCRHRALSARDRAIWPGHGQFTTSYGTRIGAQLLARFANFHGSQFFSPTMICWGLGRLWARAHRDARDQHQGGHGRARAAHHPVGRRISRSQPNATAPQCYAGRRARCVMSTIDVRRHRSRREIRRRVHHPAGHRRARWRSR